MNYTQLYGNIDKETTLARYTALKQYYIDNFNSQPSEYFSSPSRCEIVGNHTDHNLGRVLVGAINRDIIACASKSDNNVRIFSRNYEPIIIENMDTCYYEMEENTSTALVRGILYRYAELGYKIGGMNVAIDSNIPCGVGMSSSASFEMLICVILNELYNDGKISKFDMAKVSQYAENNFFGKPCGLLDQCGIAFGGVTFIDFRNIEQLTVQTVEPIKLQSKMLLINTGGDHADLTNEYQSILTDMSRMAWRFGRKYLGEVDKDVFFSMPPKDTLEYKRALHFFEENERVLHTLNAIKENDEEMFLICIANSGYSSRHNLGNCTLSSETESPITLAMDELKLISPECATRVHGGGFRGTVLAFVNNKQEIMEKIYEKFGKDNVYEIEFRNYGTTKVPNEILEGL